MPSREPELYKDKIEVSLDGRQIFYLFFGGAAIVGLVFVLGVMVGRRVEARGHLDRAETQTASDPLAALDRLERSDNLSFHGALTGSEAPTDVEKAIEAHAKKVEPRPEARPEKLEAKPEKLEAKPEKHDGEKHDGDKHDGDKKPKKHDDKSEHAERADKPEKQDKPDKPVTRPDGKDDHKDREAKADDKPERADKSETKAKFTLQLSSFQDKAEAEALLSAVKSAGFQPYLTQAEVTGKGTFYRVRLGNYRSVEAANDAKAELEKAAHKSAQVMRL